jgi:hypothetical protein
LKTHTLLTNPVFHPETYTLSKNDFGWVASSYSHDWDFFSPTLNPSAPLSTMKKVRPLCLSFLLGGDDVLAKDDEVVGFVSPGDENIYGRL